MLVAPVVRRAHDKGIQRIALDVVTISSATRAWHPAASVAGSSLRCSRRQSPAPRPGASLGALLRLRVMLPMSLTSPALTLCASWTALHCLCRMSSTRCCSHKACARFAVRNSQLGLGGSIAVSRGHVGKLLANGKPLVSLEPDKKTIDVPCCRALDGCSVAEVYVLAEVARLPARWRAAFLSHCWSSALPLPACNAARGAAFAARRIARAARSHRSAPVRRATASMLRALAASGTVVRHDRAAVTACIGWRSSCVDCECTAAQCAGPRAARLAPGSNGLGWRAVSTALLCTQPGYEHISAWVGAPLLCAPMQPATVLVLYAWTCRIVGCGVVGSWAELLTSSVALGAELAEMLCSPAHWHLQAGAVQ